MEKHTDEVEEAWEDVHEDFTPSKYLELKWIELSDLTNWNDWRLMNCKCFRIILKSISRGLLTYGWAFIAFIPRGFFIQQVLSMLSFGCTSKNGCPL